LAHFEVRARLLSCRAQNEDAAAGAIIALLEKGTDAAFVSDAGTPALSDPGAHLAARVLQAGHDVVPIPGVSAFSTLVSVAAAADKGVIFEGFLSPKAGRRRQALQELLASGRAFVLYESPYRVLKLLSDLADLDNARYVCVGREMTKLYEEFLRGTAAHIIEQFADREPQGEFAVYVSANAAK
jgi:16S rRNA (cytidine1402-2'-O)-methyltransferase